MATKHRIISDTLREELAAGSFGESGRLPTEAQLVERFHASRPTVSRALRTLVEEGLVERRVGSGTFAIENAHPTDDPQNRTLALLMPDLGNTGIFQVISGELASLARLNDYNLMWSGSSQPQRDTDTTAEHADRLCEQFIDKRVAGVFFAPYELVPGAAELNRSIPVRLREAGIPVVLLDREILPFPARSDFDIVGVDDVLGGYLIGEHFIKLGCKNLTFLFCPNSAPTVYARAAGVREAFHRSNLPQQVTAYTGDPTDLTFVRTLIANPHPDAIACANDHTAAQLIQSLARLRVGVPAGVRVAGFDDVEFATLANPPLTTVSQPCREIGQLAFRTMLNRIEDPSMPIAKHVATPRLVVRDSCGAYRR